MRWCCRPSFLSVFLLRAPFWNDVPVLSLNHSNISWRHAVVHKSFLPLRFLKFGPNPAFCATVFIKVLSLFTPTGVFFEPRFAGARFYIAYSQIKRCIVGFHFHESLFCVDFEGLYWTFLVVRHSKHFHCNGSYFPWIVSWTSFGFSFIEFEVLLPCGSFDKVLRLPSTFLWSPCNLVTRNGLCRWTTPCLKALLPWNFPRDPFQTELEYLPHLKQQKHWAWCPCLSVLDPFALTEVLSEFAQTRRLS